MNKLVVGFMGKAGVGKDTAGDYLVRQYGFKKDSFAAPLKRLVGDIFSIPDSILNPVDAEARQLREVPLADWPNYTPRMLLQFIGTELFRNQVDRDIWVKSLCHRILHSKHNLYVLTDIRFPNEFNAMAEQFGKNFIGIKITRDGCSGETHGGMKAHESEAYDLPCHHAVANDGTLEDLYAKVNHIVQDAYWSVASKDKVSC